MDNKMWLEVRSRLVKKRLRLTKTIVTSFSFVSIKRDNFFIMLDAIHRNV